MQLYLYALLAIFLLVIPAKSAEWPQGIKPGEVNTAEGQILCGLQGHDTFMSLVKQGDPGAVFRRVVSGMVPACGYAHPRFRIFIISFVGTHRFNNGALMATYTTSSPDNPSVHLGYMYCLYRENFPKSVRACGAGTPDVEASR